LGLLVLRLTASFNALLHARDCFFFSGMPALEAWLVGAAWMAVGFSLLIGFLTSVAGSLAALANVGIVLTSFLSHSSIQLVDKLPAIEMIVILFAIAALGPGAVSLDARLFGHREIVIPATPRPPRV